MSQKKKRKVFITTAIDYTNDVIHVGHAYEKILADCLARYFRLKNGEENVLFTTGTDEHGTTNQKAAEERGLSPKEHVSEVSLLDKQQIECLNISYNRFIRTTDPDHEEMAADFFGRSLKNGDIYKNKYQGYYCEGCESHKTLNELDEKRQCPNHPSRQIQLLDEENYFFRWSKYGQFLKKIISDNQLVIKPEGKRSEMLAFLESGLKDITVSRPKYKVSWGITTPHDSEQVIYVWFDALINYFTEGSRKGFWDEDTKIIHFVGKDIARWHALLWPAMLKSAGYRIPDVVYVHGFLNLEGQKISKSLGNIIRPDELVSQFGADVVRYYLLKYGPVMEDTNMSKVHMGSIYNGELANGLGNTVSRLARLGETSELEFPEKVKGPVLDEQIFSPLEDFRADKVLTNVWKELADLDKHINEHQPWSLKSKPELKKVLGYEVDKIRQISVWLRPFMPETSAKIDQQFASPRIRSTGALFPRLQTP